MNKIILIVIAVILSLTSYNIFAAPVELKFNADGSTTVVKNGGSYGFPDGTKVTSQQTSNIVGCSTGGDCSMFNQNNNTPTTQNTTNSTNSITPSPSASTSSNLPKDMSTDNILGIPTDDLRNGNITMTDVPVMIASMIEYILALVGSICVVALIYHAVCMQFASGITGDSTGVDKAKKGMKGAILGFALSMSAWFLMTKLVALLSTL